MYLETQSAVVVPKEGDLFEVFNSGQDRLVGQIAVSVALGVPGHKILMHNTRCGGGFGGKIMYQTVFLTAVAVAAYKLRRAVRLQNERSDDMQMMGNRHPISYRYTATFDVAGTLDALTLESTADAGWTGAGYGQAAAGICDNNYRWNVYAPSGKDAFTAKPSNTPMRAPPTMQSALAGEVILEHVAKSLNMDLDEVMEKNFLKIGDTTQQGNKVGTDTMNFTIPELWAQIQSDSKYKERKAAVKAYNAANRWTKKGISLTTSRWDFPGPGNAYMLGAHVSIFADGTVMVSSGGVEIGQGLNTKVAMAVAHAFGIDMSMVSVGDGNSNVLPNSGTTGGSGTSECCVFAAQQACKVLKKRLEIFLSKAGQDWTKAVGAAVAAGVDLGASGWNTGEWDKSDGKTNNVAYAVYGACVSEVMVDVLTGDIRLERVDILMDLGSQLNAAVDLGQVQGGYVMALGYLFSEQQQWDSAGKLLNQGTWEYKIPTAYDIPVEFNVALLKDTPNPNGVQSSKAVAEPAMHLIAGPYLAAKNAIYAARTEVGHKDEWIPVNVPLTPEAIRTAIDVPADQLTLP
jgi:xanthine dehydrogenase/oxidase